MTKLLRSLVLFECAAALVFSGCGEASYFEMTEEETVSEEANAKGFDNVEANAKNSDNVETETVDDGQEEEDIYVQVAGAVHSPGVYALDAKSRVFEAIEAAGGLSENADDSSLNQAGRVTDGEKIYVYAIGEAVPEESGSSAAAERSDDRVNINTATESELMTLPGIGQSKATAIIDYRESHGGFSKVEDIMQVEGIKEGTYNKISDGIRL